MTFPAIIFHSSLYLLLPLPSDHLLFYRPLFYMSSSTRNFSRSSSTSLVVGKENTFTTFLARLSPLSFPCQLYHSPEYWPTYINYVLSVRETFHFIAIHSFIQSHPNVHFLWPFKHLRVSSYSSSSLFTKAFVRTNP